MIFDITTTLGNDTAVYDGDPPVRITRLHSIDSDGYALSVLSLCTHSGTHIDAPSHFIPGAAAVSDIPLATLMGPCTVADDERSAADALISGCERLIALFSPSPAFIELVCGSSLKLLGTPELTIGGDDVHRALLGRGVVLLENLEMTGISCGTYELAALPLKISADGPPVRAVLKEMHT